MAASSALRTSCTPCCLRVVLDRALAAAAGVDLGLHDGERAAELLERGGRFVGRAWRRCFAARRRRPRAAVAWPGIRESSSGYSRRSGHRRIKFVTTLWLKRSSIARSGKQGQPPMRNAARRIVVRQSRVSSGSHASDAALVAGVTACRERADAEPVRSAGRRWARRTTFELAAAADVDRRAPNLQRGDRSAAGRDRPADVDVSAGLRVEPLQSRAGGRMVCGVAGDGRSCRGRAGDQREDGRCARRDGRSAGAAVALSARRTASGDGATKLVPPT